MRKLSLVMAIVLSVLLVQAVQAHPADVYFQTYSVSFSPAGMGIIWEIKPGALLAQSIWTTADQNQDQVISQDEVQSWVGPLLPELRASLDDRPLGLTLQSVEWPSSLDKFRIGDEPIRIHLAADWPPGGAQTGQLTVESLFAQKSSVNWFKLSAAGGTAFETPEQQAGALKVHVAYSSAGQGGASTQHWSTAWESGQPSIPAVANTLGLPASTGQIVQQQGLSGVLDQLIRSGGTSPLFFLAALALALVTGALHALTPGHGKTIVAAYLVGSRGTIRHAILLGATVTLTHTGSVFLLGAVMLIASQYILPTTFVPILEVVSGLLIIVLGGSLLYQRWRAWRHGQSGHDHEHDHDHDHHHDHNHDHDGHSHEVDHDHHQHPDPSAVTWRTLLALGISGGLVPCPEAIAILLLAVTINRIALGLALILAFSLGLAIVLITIGIAMVKSKQFVSRFRMFERWAPVVPMVSALVVLGFGVALTISALQNTAAIPQPAGVQSAAIKAVFDLRQARVAFTAMDSQEHNQLFVVSAGGGVAQQITREPLGILDYSVAPDGKSLIYSSNLDNGGTDLWELDPAALKRTNLLSCTDAFCSDAMWSRDTSRILYSRLDLRASDPLGVPSVWWLQLATHETGPAFQDARMPLLAPSWSTDGTRLAYTPVNSTAIQIYNLKTGKVQSVPTRTGSQVIWSPAGDALILSDVKQSGAGFPSKLFRYDLGTAQLTELTASQDFYEYDPAWSPDGVWICMLRHDVGGSGLILGDQIWLVRPDGSQLHQITQTDGIVHGRPAWSPDGRYLLYHYLVVTEHAPSKIQILDVETGQTHEVAPNGYGPSWLP